MPAESTSTRPARSLSATAARRIASAIGERQMLPVQTMMTRVNPVDNSLRLRLTGPIVIDERYLPEHEQ